MRQFYSETILPRLNELIMNYQVLEDDHHEGSGFVKSSVKYDIPPDRSLEQLQQDYHLVSWAIWFLRLIHQLEARNLPALPAPAEVKYLTLPGWQATPSGSSLRFFKWPEYNKMAITQQTVAALQHYGVSEKLIRNNWHAPGSPDFQLHAWTISCKWTLFYLVTGQEHPDCSFASAPLQVENRLSPEKALLEMSGLCGHRVQTLQKLYNHGARGEHLGRLHGTGDPEFMDGHCHALEYLILQGTPMETAITQVNEMTRHEAWTIDGCSNPMRMID